MVLDRVSQPATHFSDATKLLLANFPVAKKLSMRPGTDFSDEQSTNANIATANVTISEEE